MKKILLTITLVTFLGSSLSIQANLLNTKANKAQRIADKARNLKPSVVKLAMKASDNAKKLGVKSDKSIITLIDYSLPSTKKRLWVVDVDKEKVLYSSLVAHGKNSGKEKTISFSNTPRSRQTSIGLFLTENTYTGNHGYSLRMQGLEKGFNDNAKRRAIVIHGANYVNEKIALSGRIGRSWGCPAIEQHLTKPIINTIKNGTLVFAFYPDKNWLEKSRFFNFRI